MPGEAGRERSCGEVLLPLPRHRHRVLAGAGPVAVGGTGLSTAADVGARCLLALGVRTAGLAQHPWPPPTRRPQCGLSRSPDLASRKPCLRCGQGPGEGSLAAAFPVGAPGVGCTACPSGLCGCRAHCLELAFFLVVFWLQK